MPFTRAPVPALRREDEELLAAFGHWCATNTLAHELIELLGRRHPAPLDWRAPAPSPAPVDGPTAVPAATATTVPSDAPAEAAAAVALASVPADGFRSTPTRPEAPLLVPAGSGRGHD
jgi:hypothetical protein